MTINEILEKLKSSEYDFLKTNEHLNKNVILLGLGGSHAYGTNIATSDLDIRGCSLNSKQEILTNENFEQFTNEETDTVIYSFNKLVQLLSNCNPNTIEILGLKPEHYIFKTDIGQMLIDNSHMFLSKIAIHSFGGYANQQLRRLDNKANRFEDQAKREFHMLNSIKNAEYDYKRKYFYYSDDAIKLYLDNAVNEEFDKEIFMDINLKHYPLRDYKCMWSEMNNIIKEYGKIGQRNKKAIEHNKLAKHQMHLIRLYLMAFDILEKEQIITYRPEHDFLMNIRNGKYLDNNKQPTDEFFDIVDQLETRLKYDKDNTNLPEKPNYKKIKEFTMYVNERIVKGDV